MHLVCAHGLLGDGRLRITSSATAEGPAEQAQEIGAMVTADVPDVLVALVAQAHADAA